MSARGFTLVEVMVALFVVAVALMALVGTSGQYVRQSAELRDRMIAHWIASDRLAEYRLSGEFPEPGTARGETVQAGEPWVWLAVISPTPGEDDLRRIDVAVAHAATPDNPVLVLTGFIGLRSGPTRQEAP